MIYREATYQDDSQLLELFDLAGMPGAIELKTNRAPSFFSLVTLRGESEVFVAEENEDILGCICVSKQTSYVNRKIHDVFYISDFRVSPNHRKRGIGLKLTNTAVKYLETKGADLVFLNVSKGNKRPFVFFSNRKNYPDFERIGIFKIYQFLASGKKAKAGVFPEKTEVTQEIIDFLNDNYQDRELASVITLKYFQQTMVFTIRQENQINAIMCLSDYSNSKHQIVTGLPWYLRCLLAVINSARGLFGGQRLPSINEPIKMLYIKHLVVKDNDKGLLKILIRTAQNEANKKAYAFVSLGLHQRDPLIKSLPKIFRFTFYSVGMVVTMKNSQVLMKSIKGGIPFKDFSTV